MPASSQSFFSDTDWTVPKYVDIVRITCEGGAGGDASASSDSADGFQNCSKGAGGGNGGRAKGDLTTSPGETLYIRRNSGGSGGSAGGYATSANSGAGGDGTDVRQNGSTEGYIQIAAGGGGGGGAAAGYADGTADCVVSGGADNGNDASKAEITYSGEIVVSASGGDAESQSNSTGENGTSDNDDLYNDASAAGGGGGGGDTGGGAGGVSVQTGANGGDWADAAGAGGGGGGSATPGVSNTTTETGVISGGASIVIEYSDRITNLSLDDSVEGEITLSWTEPNDLSSYNIYRAETSGTNPSDYTQIASPSSGTSSYTDSGLEDGERYYYRVENVNSFDNRLSNEPTTITELPEATNFSATYDQDNIDADLSWTNNDNSTDGFIKVEKSSDGGSTWTEIDTVDRTDTSYIDSDVKAGDTPMYRVIRTTGTETATSATSQIDVVGSIRGTRNGVQINDSGVDQTQ